MARKVEKVGVGTIALGAFDWFARYQTGKDLIASFSTQRIASAVSVWWVSPALIVIGFALVFLGKFSLHGDAEVPEPLPPSAVADVRDSVNATATGGNVVQNFHYGAPAVPPPPRPTATA